MLDDGAIVTFEATGRLLEPDEVALVYSRSHTAASVLIRAASWWAQWSHVGLVTPQCTVIEALAFRGVVETCERDFIRRTSKRRVVRVRCPDPAAAIGWARSQLGAGYDYGAIAQFVLREPLDSKTRRHCAELVEMALVAGGAQRFRIPPHRITPSQSFMVA